MSDFKRGALTEEIKQKFFEFFGEGYIPSTTELRLLPYLQYCVINDDFSLRNVNDTERVILNRWREAGYLNDMNTPSKVFWDFISEVLWMGYVRHKDKFGETNVTRTN